MSDAIAEFLGKLDADQAAVVRAVMALFREAGPELAEDFKYGGVVFLKDGALIGGVYAYKDYISVEFSKGAGFDDPGGVLDGKGKLRRHVKLVEMGDVAQKSVAGFVGQAAGG